MSRKIPATVKSATGKIYTLSEVASEVGMSLSWVSRMYSSKGFTTLEEFEICRNSAPAYNSIRQDIKKFNRKLVCYKGDFLSQCAHYASCLHARCLGEHHERYKKDGSCYIKSCKVFKYIHT